MKSSAVSFVLPTRSSTASAPTPIRSSFTLHQLHTNPFYRLPLKSDLNSNGAERKSTRGLTSDPAQAIANLILPSS